MGTRRSFLASIAGLPLFAGSLATSSVLAFPVPYPNDTRLNAIANEMEKVQALVDAYKGDDDGFAEINGRFDPLMSEMDGIDADTFAGVLHKLRAIELPGVGEEGSAHDIMCSICSDITRMHISGLILCAGSVPLV